MEKKWNFTIIGKRPILRSIFWASFPIKGHTTKECPKERPSVYKTISLILCRSSFYTSLWYWGRLKRKGIPRKCWVLQVVEEKRQSNTESVALRQTGEWMPIRLAANRFLEHLWDFPKQRKVHLSRCSTVVAGELGVVSPAMNREIGDFSFQLKEGKRNTWMLWILYWRDKT